MSSARSGPTRRSLATTGSSPGGSSGSGMASRAARICARTPTTTTSRCSRPRRAAVAETGDEYMIEQNWVRLEKNKTALAARLRDLADEVDRISMVRHGDVRRQPIDIVAEVNHTLTW